MPNWLTNILSYLSVVGLSVPLAAFLLFKFLGSQLVQNLFVRNLETFKHDLSVQLTRKEMWYEKEHVVLQRCWKKIVRARNDLNDVITNFCSIPDINSFNSEQLDAFIEDESLSKLEAVDLRLATDRTKVYLRILEAKKMNKARISLLYFIDYYDENRIFLSDDVKNNFRSFDDKMRESWASLATSKIVHNTVEDYHAKASKILSGDVDLLIAKIESILNNRLSAEGEAAKSN